MESMIPLLESVKDLGGKSCKEIERLSDLLYEVETGVDNSSAELVSFFSEIKKYPEMRTQRLIPLAKVSALPKKPVILATRPHKTVFNPTRFVISLHAWRCRSLFGN